MIIVIYKGIETPTYLPLIINFVCKFINTTSTRYNMNTHTDTKIEQL